MVLGGCSKKEKVFYSDCVHVPKLGLNSLWNVCEDVPPLLRERGRQTVSLCCVQSAWSGSSLANRSVNTCTAVPVHHRPGIWWGHTDDRERSPTSVHVQVTHTPDYDHREKWKLSHIFTWHTTLQTYGDVTVSQDQFDHKLRCHTRVQVDVCTFAPSFLHSTRPLGRPVYIKLY